MNWLMAQAEPPGTGFWGIEPSSQLFWFIVITLIVTTLLLFAISRVPSNLRKPISVGITFLAGMFYVLEWLIPRSRSAAGDQAAYLGPINFEEVVPIVSSISQVLTGMLLALGVLSIFRLHFGRVFKMQKDWFFSGVLLVSLFLMVFLGLASFVGDEQVKRQQAGIDAALRGVTPAFTPEMRQFAETGIDLQATLLMESRRAPPTRLYQQRIMTKEQFDQEITTAQAEVDTLRATLTDGLNAAATSNTLTPEMSELAKQGIAEVKERKPLVQGFSLLFQRGLLAMDAAMFSLIGFFILSAAYRAFRIRSIEASILMATALVVLLMFVPIALMLTSGLDPNSFQGNFRIDSVGMWLLSTINVPAIRAIDLGLGLGLLAMALRIMLGLEKGVAAD
ncbi:MAG: hypothetical protein ACR2HJ_02820 [Fimbriimonadales bacterium]